MGTKASIPKLLIIHSFIHPSIHPGGLSLFQWYNQRAQQQTGGTLVCKISTQCLGDLNQPECFSFLTKFCPKKGREF